MIRKIAIVIMLILSVLWVGFIFSNSLDNAEESVEKSSVVTETVNKVATAVGVQEEIPESSVRNMAHFGEFAFLAAILCIDVILITFPAFLKPSKRFLIPCVLILPFCFVIACIDELIQLFSNGRAAQLSDTLLDTAGALSSLALFFAIYFTVILIQKRRGRLKN